MATLSDYQAAPIFLVLPEQCEEITRLLCGSGAQIYQISSLNQLPSMGAPRIAAQMAQGYDKRYLDGLLKKLGVSQHIQGYRCIEEGVKLLIQQPAMGCALTKQLYPAIAKACGMRPYAVERAIRYAIETAWEKCDARVLEEMFGSLPDPRRGKLTTGEFLMEMTSMVQNRDQT